MRYAFILAGIVLTMQPAAFSQGFSYTKIIDGGTLRPDGLGLFTNPHSASTDGQYVVWSEQYGDYSIWSAKLSDLKPVRLADTSTPSPGGTGHFTQFGQTAGGVYSAFSILVRNGTAAFLGIDNAGQGIYSVPAAGGAIRRVVNYNTPLPNGAQVGTAGTSIAALGLNDSGVVAFSGLASGTAHASVYTAGSDGSNLTLIADEAHRYTNPLQAPGATNSCVQSFGGVAVNGNSVVFIGAGGGTYWGIYSLPISGPVQGVSPETCGNGPAGPVVVNSGNALPGDPFTGQQLPDYDFVQTDGTNVYFHGSDFAIGCCSSLSGNWGGIFSVSLGGGPITKIVENGDVLPVIGKVTNVSAEFSVDGGGVVFIASNESVSPVLRGIFLASGGQIRKVLASGDMLDGVTFTQTGALEVWPQSYKNGVVAFVWNQGVFVAKATTFGTPPFGIMDTPADRATGISGAISVTGWALSPAGVSNVGIWRDPVAGETGSGMVFLTNATSIPGSRPDVASAYPGYPYNSSGWGAQVLTNQLPGISGGPLGTGTYRIYAIATGYDGTQATIAAHTITTDNVHALLPFGTIDTPAQGGTVSGSAYVNFGWAVTPNPANVIPKDGSSIFVYVDGKPVGHPVYNNNRSDIATLFPGLQNSNGAVGYYVMDTTKLTNGLHTISWSVTDSAGNAQGLGSRFFIVKN